MSTPTIIDRITEDLTDYLVKWHLPCDTRERERFARIELGVMSSDEDIELTEEQSAEIVRHALIGVECWIQAILRSEDLTETDRCNRVWSIGAQR